MVSDDLLKLVICPITRQALRFAGADVVDRINKQGTSLCNQGGTPLEQPLLAALVTVDGQWLYPVRHGIPILLSNEAILLQGSLS